MPDLFITFATAFWLGILTSISPCPLATNIAAISFVGRKVDKPAMVLLSGLIYTLGRMLAYTALGLLLVGGMQKVPILSHLLQKYMNMLLGPILIIIGMILLELLSFNLGKGRIANFFKNKFQSLGLLGAGLMGIIFALSFCPTSAALFFGSLLPLSLQQQSGIVLYLVYGIATGIPVLVFAVLLALGAKQVGKAYNKVVFLEKWARKITGVLFIGIGIYYSLVYIFALPLQS
ncbi:MAG: aromatic aminobenezylarsenical efflux permease ArsG family transporter [Myxococcota bacterium]